MGSVFESARLPVVYHVSVQSDQYDGCQENYSPYPGAGQHVNVVVQRDKVVLHWFAFAVRTKKGLLDRVV